MLSILGNGGQVGQVYTFGVYDAIRQVKTNKSSSARPKISKEYRDGVRSIRHKSVGHNKITNENISQTFGYTGILFMK